MRRAALTIAVVLAALAAAPASAPAGGWATVGLSSLPQGQRPGEPWVVDISVLQHGRTPLEGVVPIVTISAAAGGATRSFPADPTGKPGVYRAEVVFPTRGRWEYSVDDGFSQSHRFAPVDVGGTPATPAAAAPREPAPAAPAAREPAPAPASGGGGAPWAWPAGGVVAAVAVAAALALGMRRRRRGAEPALG
jgi:hypothetical protein